MKATSDLIEEEVELLTCRIIGFKLEDIPNLNWKLFARYDPKEHDSLAGAYEVSFYWNWDDAWSKMNPATSFVAGSAPLIVRALEVLKELNRN